MDSDKGGFLKELVSYNTRYNVLLSHHLVSYKATMACKKYMTIVLWPCGVNDNNNMPSFCVFMIMTIFMASLVMPTAKRPMTFDIFVSSEAIMTYKKFMTCGLVVSMAITIK